jgi:DNA polymerase-3 subunit alpha
MAYVTLEDGTGTIELLAFQKVLETCGKCLKVNSPIIAYGRLSARDEKEPQVMLNSAAFIVEEKLSGSKRSEERKLYVKLPSETDMKYERLKLVLNMFPGGETLIMYFDDTKKKLAGRCVIHEALVEDLGEMLGSENVVLQAAGVSGGR